MIKENKMFKVYGKESCAPCRTVKMILDKKGIAYDYIDIEEDVEALDEMIGLYEMTTVPIVVSKGRVMYGYTPSILMDMIKDYYEQQKL